MKVSQNYEQLRLVLEETLENGEISKEDFCRLTVVREAVVKNLLPHELYRLDTKKMKKSIRITFQNEGNMVDFGAGRREFFKIATKALFAAGEVFCQEEKCDFFRLKKGAELLLVKEAGFLLGLATLNNIELRSRPILLCCLSFEDLGTGKEIQFGGPQERLLQPGNCTTGFPR